MNDIELLFSRIEEHRCRRMQSLLASIPACPGLQTGPHGSDIRHQEEIEEERRIGHEIYCKKKENLNA